MAVAILSACGDDESKRDALALENARCAAAYAELVEYARRKNSDDKESYEASMKGHWMAGVILVGDRFPGEAAAAAKALRPRIEALPSMDALPELGRKLTEGCSSVVPRSMRLAGEMTKARAASKP